MSISTKIRRLKRRWNTIKTWIPIILKDDHHDSFWLYRILKVKLQLMENFYRTEAFRVDRENIANEIKDAEKLCERLECHNYYNDVPSEMKHNPLKCCREEGELMLLDIRKLLKLMENMWDWGD